MTRKTVVCTALVTVVALSTARGADLLSNGGFETYEDTSTRPADFGDWGGDPSSIVPAENAVVPYEGSQMLRFDFASGYGASEHVASEVWQAVDLSAYSELIQQGDAVALGSAYVNRIHVDAETDQRMGINLYAFKGLLADFQLGGPNELARQGGSIVTDGDPSTWEVSSCQLALPSVTSYVVVWTYANENVMNDTTGTEFNGHYCDSVAIAIVPEPATLALLGMGALGLMRRRRRR